MRNTRPFIKTANRGSAYCTRGGAFWIIKTAGLWHLVRMGRPAENLERKTLGRFRTLREAVAAFMQIES